MVPNRRLLINKHTSVAFFIIKIVLKQDVKDAVTGDGAKFSGWLLHFIPGNWFRRKWVKRWVVLRDESLYMYESQVKTIIMFYFSNFRG